MTQRYNNYSLQECDEKLQQYVDLIRTGRMTFYQKFTCEKCWSRITQDEPNKLFAIGHCQECGHFTDLVRDGCNYSVMFKGRRSS